MTPIPALLMLSSILVTDAVVVPLDALAPSDPPPADPPVTVLVDSMVATILPGDETELELVWKISALEPTWVDLGMTGNALTLSDAEFDGHSVGLPPAPDGYRYLTVHLDGHHTLRVRGSIATPERTFDLPVLAAARMHASVLGEGWDVEIADALGSGNRSFVLAGADHLAVAWSPAGPPSQREVVVGAEAVTAIRLDASGLEGVSTLRYHVRHGTVDHVEFRLPHGAADLEVKGALVEQHTIQGEQVRVDLRKPTRGRFEIGISYRAPPSDDEATAPLPIPQGATEGWITVLRGDDSTIAPDPVRDLESISSSQLPAWARGLVAGTTIAAYRVAGRSPTLRVRVMQYDPAEEPPTLVDEARYEVAYAAHGGVLLRAQYQVRNDRNQYLQVSLPLGFSLIGVRVAGDVVQPVSDGGDVLFVPLEKSVETLQGLVSFPVEVLLWGEEASWDRRGLRALSTPAIDAPVAYARWEVVLPPDLAARETRGIPTLVEDWSSRAGGLAYGKAHGEQLDDDEDLAAPQYEMAAVSRAPRRQKVGGKSSGSTSSRGAARAHPLATPAATEPSPDPAEAPMDDWVMEELSQSAQNQAYRAYQDNRFRDAQAYLDKSLELNPDNRAASALQSNVNLLLGEGEDEGKGDDGQGDEVMERRVREMARSRTASVVVAQEKKKRKAEASLRAGDLEAAKEEYEQLAELTEQLTWVEHEESFDNKAMLEEVERQISDLDRMVAHSEAQTVFVPEIVTSPVSATSSFGGNVVIDFEEMLIEGSLESPDSHWYEVGGLEAFEDEDGRPDTGVLAGLDGATVMAGETASTDTLDLVPGAATIVLLDAPPAEDTGRGGGGRYGARAEGRDRSRGPAKNQRWADDGDAFVTVSTETHTKTPMADIPVEVTAAQLTLRVPRAGQVLYLEQRLVPENTPLTIEVSYRPNSGRNR